VDRGGPVTDHETVHESYQEPYDDTESYVEQVPYTEYRTRTELCGTATCTTSEPITAYRSERKTRTVTRHRTAWRTVTKAVTKYRSVPRSFHFEALEQIGHYASRLRVTFDDLPT
jgi:hypothetical protein